MAGLQCLYASTQGSQLPTAADVACTLCCRYEDVAVLPHELLKQPVSQQSQAALADSARIRSLLRGR